MPQPLIFESDITYNRPALLGIKAILIYRNPDKVENEELEEILQGLPDSMGARLKLVVRWFGVEANPSKEAKPFNDLVEFMSPKTKENERAERLRAWSESGLISGETLKQFTTRLNDSIYHENSLQELHKTIIERTLNMTEGSYERRECMFSSDSRNPVSKYIPLTYGRNRGKHGQHSGIEGNEK
ncbi:hypothetical protein TEQG_07498 [Trichophyton equinum CBS 127.97]|uniref:Uncharacterized protein n=1 Tax=Trichophyton equinum (strain ATCC MYA-4606 / CBS 127.97) TaxID=559882 RepID=F2Q2M3_TRIEC|nr:hypothetical protein TEQG_07498 [Trichophyton equinum CBS 127.97]